MVNSTAMVISVEPIFAASGFLGKTLNQSSNIKATPAVISKYTIGIINANVTEPPSETRIAQATSAPIDNLFLSSFMNFIEL